jgi:F-type H+-transporting ATPase subunit epsilon
MPPVYELTVLAPERTVYRGRARSLVAPGVEGYFGVLAHHAPMVAGLGTGLLEVEDEAGMTRSFALSGGFLEVGGNEVHILADVAEAAEDIDVARAEAAQRRARERLGSRDQSIDVARAQAALQRALNRLRVAGQRRET